MNTKVRTSISFWSLCCALFFTALATIGLSSVAEAQWNISVTPSTTNVTAGTNLSYEITAGNTSIFTRNNAKATITLPFTALPGMKSVFHVADNVSCDTSAAPVIVCPLGNVSALSSKTFRITVKVSDGYVVATNGAGFISFPVQVSADSGSSSTANSPVVNVNELADLKVSQFSSSLNPRAGDVFTYSIYVDNFGPSAARGVELYTVIGTGGLSPEQKVSVQSCAFSVSQGCGAITQFSCTTGEVSLGQFLANIGKFATDHLRPVTNEDATCGADSGSNNPVGRIRGSFRIVAPEDMDMTGMVSVESSTPDEDYSDNQGSQLYDITGVSDVSINKTATGEVLVDGEEGLPYNVIIGAPFPEAPTFTTSSLVVTQGRRVRYEIVVANDGPSKAENVVVTDRLPPGVSVVPGSLVITDHNGDPTSGSCQFGTPGDVNDKMTCGLGTINVPHAPPAILNEVLSKTVTFDVIVDLDVAQNTILTNNATVSSDSFEDDNSDNAVTAFSVVSPIVGVSGCSVGGPYTNIICGNGSASIDLNGFGFALPDGGPLTYAWSTDCPDASFTSTAVANPSLSFTTANPDNTPVTCQVQLDVSNIYADSSCTGAVTVVDCTVDCNGLLGGTAELDRCGVCEGDGNSCLGCKDFDVTSNVYDVSLANTKLKTLTFRASRQFAAAADSAAGDTQARKIRRKARLIFQASEAGVSTIPAQMTTCSNNLFCVSTSNVSTLTSISSSSTDALSLLKRTVNHLRDASGNPKAGKRILNRANGFFGTSQLSLASIPLSSSTCS